MSQSVCSAQRKDLAEQAFMGVEQALEYLQAPMHQDISIPSSEIYRIEMTPLIYSSRCHSIINSRRSMHFTSLDIEIRSYVPRNDKDYARYALRGKTAKLS